ncbi:MAG: polysaccharide pyruvyl transferase family protein [Anaerolineales bacterium]|nr:polysaccharide pyruvyl transferase family protein [Anaerolineales bacterium]
MIPAARLRRYTWQWLAGAIVDRVFGRKVAAMEARYRREDLAIAKADVVLSIGGDNYCYGPPYRLYAIDRAVKRAGKKLVLWGCSIEPEAIQNDHEMRKDLALFDLITPRESITYQALLDAGVNTNVHLHADPAFAMVPEPVSLPDGWQPGNVLGLNLSPLIMRYQHTDGDLLTHARALVQHVLQCTDLTVALIPHVTQARNNDWDVLSQLYQPFADSRRVLLLGQQLNSPQTKYLISQCRLFIGARTHSTIAAYGTRVPTLALGYSVKARGIARDIFGSEEGLVLPIQQLTEAGQLISAFEALREREDDLRCHLAEVMPGYIQSAWDAGKHVAELLS